MRRTQRVETHSTAFCALATVTPTTTCGVLVAVSAERTAWPCRSFPVSNEFPAQVQHKRATHPAITSMLISVEERPVPNQGRGSEAALQSRWQIPERASSKDGSAQEPYCSESGCSRFIHHRSGSKTSAAHSRAERVVAAAGRERRGAQGYKPLDLRSDASAQYTASLGGTSVRSRQGCNSPPH
jgi:hypothetical protein